MIKSIIYKNHHPLINEKATTVLKVKFRYRVHDDSVEELEDTLAGHSSKLEEYFENSENMKPVLDSKGRKKEGKFQDTIRELYFRECIFAQGANVTVKAKGNIPLEKMLKIEELEKNILEGIKLKS